MNDVARPSNSQLVFSMENRERVFTAEDDGDIVRVTIRGEADGPHEYYYLDAQEAEKLQALLGGFLRKHSTPEPCVRRRPTLEESNAWTCAEEERDWWRNYALQIERSAQPPADDSARLNWWFMNVLHVGGDEDDDEAGSDIEYEARLCRTPDEFRAMIDAAMGRTPTKSGEQV